MTAVVLRFRAELRARWRSWMLLGVVAGLLGGLVIAGFAGARRADSALERLLEASRAQDVTIAKGFVFQNYDLDFERIKQLPQVVRASRDRPLAALIRTSEGEQMYGGHENSVIPLASPDGSQGSVLNRPTLVAGSLPAAGRRDEILADAKAAEILGVEVGDTVSVRFIWRRLLGHPRAVDFSAHPERAEVGPLARLRIAGVHARTGSDDFSGELRVPPAVYRAHGGPALGSFQEILNVQLRRGAADVPAFRAAVDRIAGPGDFIFSPAEADRVKVQRSIRLEARALRLVGAVGALTLLLLLAQALMRQAAQVANDHPTLRAVGMTRGQLIAAGVGGAAVVGLIAAALAVPVAIALSPLMPVGRARDLEPSPGVDVDVAALAVGAAALLVAALAAGVVAATRAALAPRARRSPSGVVPAARRALPPALLAGLSMTLTRGAHPAVTRLTIAGAIAAVAVAAMALTFSASLDRLLTTPSLYGQNWDYEAPFDPSDVPKLRAGEGIPGLPPGRWLSGAAAGTGSRLVVGGKLVGVNAYDDIRGRVPPTVVEGRAPRGPDEILLAQRTLEQLDLRVGDRVAVRRGERAAQMRIVGEGVVPESEWVEFGEGAALTFAGFKRVVPDAILFQVHLSLAPGPRGAAGLARLESHYDWAGPARPSSIGDFDGIRSAPALMVTLLGGAAAAALGHALLTTVRERRRELAILKTLGFVRGQVLAAVAWQATIIAAAGLIAGVPLGIAAGRLVWNLFAEDLGVVPAPVVPVAAILLIVPATLLLANLIAAIPGRMAARTRPALALRAE